MRPQVQLFLASSRFKTNQALALVMIASVAIKYKAIAG
jgi:hypothetical protein